MQSGVEPAEPDAPVESGGGGRRGRRGYLLPGAIALVALLAIGLGIGAGGDLTHPPPKSLHGSDVADQIALSIQSEQNDKSLPTVRCPDDQPVRAGYTFTCSLQQGRSTRTVNVKEIDGRGHLRWSLGPAAP
jgi:Domain of unknown function (DUF4333)